MSVETEVALLTVATNNLLTAVSVSRGALDTSTTTGIAKAAEAAASANLANNKAGEAAGSAASALAVFGTAEAIAAALAEAQHQASLAKFFAVSTSGTAQLLDVAGVVSDLHRNAASPVVAMAVYDTSVDSDGGVWVDKTAGTSWHQEALNGAWLGWRDSETGARATARSPRTGQNWQHRTGVAGDGFVTFNGSAGGATLERRPEHTFAGDVDLRACLELVSWAEADQSVVSSYEAGGMTSFILRLSASGVLTFFSFDTVNRISNSTEVVPFGGGAKGWVRCTYERVGLVNFYTSTDGMTYTQLGTTVRHPMVGPLQLQLAALQVAAYNATGSGWPLNGKLYRAEFRSGLNGEIVASYENVSASAAGSYYQLVSDGKFYRLNAGSGATEVFRGNSAPFPALAGVVAEAGRVVIYDLTQSSCPMWRVTRSSGALAVGTINTVAAGQGAVFVGGTTGLGTLHYAEDRLSLRDTINLRAQALLATERTAAFVPVTGAAVLVDRNVLAVSLAVPPLSRLSPVSMLAVPVVAVLTNNGVSVITDSGLVSSDAFRFNTDMLGFADNAVLVYTNNNNFNSICTVDVTELTASTFTPVRTATLKPGVIGQKPNVTFNGRVQAGIPVTSGVIEGRVYLYVLDRASASSNSLAAVIAATFNTGWFLGDSRRVLLADTDTGAISGANLATHNSADFTTGVGSWVSSSSFPSTAVAVNGELQITATVSSGRQILSLPTVIGKTYTARVMARRISGVGNAALVASNAAGSSTHGDGSTQQSTLSITPVELQVQWTATDAVSYVCLGEGASLPEAVLGFSSFSVVEAALDRVAPFKAMSVIGRLTRAPVAAGAQLCGYTGFTEAGTANCLAQEYSADLDFGTAAWSVSAWVTIPVGIAAVGTLLERRLAEGAYFGVGVDAFGKFTATVFDGTTTRTVITAAAYNTNTWTHVRVQYAVTGALSIAVNGVSVATTTGAALLSLNNTTAKLFIGRARIGNAPWPGSLALVKVSAGNATADQAEWIYAQEAPMFSVGAEVILPSNTSVFSFTYSAATNTFIAAQSSRTSRFSGLVRVATRKPLAGNFWQAQNGAGVELLSRVADLLQRTNIVDVILPGVSVRKDILRRRNGAAQKVRLPVDFIAAAAQADFPLPLGYTALEVYQAGALKRRGAIYDWVRVCDGFRETVRFAVAPGASVWVQVIAER